MYISRIYPDTDRRVPQRTVEKLADKYGVHKLVWRFFGDDPDRDRDFIYRRDERSGLPLFYTVSERKPRANGELWKVDVKDYDPALAAGDTLEFLVRVNPVIKRRTDDGKQVRHDVVMDAKTQLREEGTEVPPQQELVQEECSQWLQKRGDIYGFKANPDHLRAHSYRQHQFKKHRDGRTIHLSSADIEGLLTVENPETFQEMLFEGIGPAKAFGFGLMLVRRP